MLGLLSGKLAIWKLLAVKWALQTILALRLAEDTADDSSVYYKAAHLYVTLYCGLYTVAV